MQLQRKRSAYLFQTLQEAGHGSQRIWAVGTYLGLVRVRMVLPERARTYTVTGKKEYCV